MKDKQSDEEEKGGQGPPEEAPDGQGLCLVNAQPEGFWAVLDEHLVGILAHTCLNQRLLRQVFFALTKLRLRQLPLHSVTSLPACSTE